MRAFDELRQAAFALVKMGPSSSSRSELAARGHLYHNAMLLPSLSSRRLPRALTASSRAGRSVLAFFFW